MHLLIHFCGTGDTGETFYNNCEYLKQLTDLRIIFVEGCDHPQVCNAYLFPDLEEFARRFVSYLFTRKTTHNIVQSPTFLFIRTQYLSQVGINVAHSSLNLGDLNQAGITGIILSGYSRGAVVCFNVARALFNIAPEIPVDVIADQPVPGNYYPLFFNNAGRALDCHDLLNLKNVYFILGAYTGFVVENKTRYRNESHVAFFSQIVPHLSYTTQQTICVIPRESHHETETSVPCSSLYMHLYIAKSLHLKNILDLQVIENFTADIRRGYLPHPKPFPPSYQLQKIFGLSREVLYRYCDPLHPYPDIRRRLVIKSGQSLSDWWMSQDAQNFAPLKESINYLEKLLSKLSHINSKDCVITSTDIENLKQLYVISDQWLINSSQIGSRFYNKIEALRSNVGYILVKDCHINKAWLDQVKHESKHKAKYVVKIWAERNRHAWFKMGEIEKLNHDFEVYRTARELSDLQAKSNNKILCDNIDSWCEKHPNVDQARLNDLRYIREELLLDAKNNHSSK